MDTRKQIFLSMSSKKSTKIVSIQSEENQSSVFKLRMKTLSLCKAAHDIFALIWRWNRYHFMKILYQYILFVLILFHYYIIYAGPTNFDFLGQPSNTSVSLSSTQSSAELEAYYQTNLGTKSRIKWQIWKVKPEH